MRVLRAKVFNGVDQFNDFCEKVNVKRTYVCPPVIVGRDYVCAKMVVEYYEEIDFVPIYTEAKK